MYTKNGCPKCDMTKNVLNGEGIEFDSINIEDETDEGREGLHFVTKVLERTEMPVLMLDGEFQFTGFHPNKLKAFK